MGAVFGWFRRHPGCDEVKRLFSELVRQAIDGLGAPLPVPEDLVEMRTMLATLGESWKRQWLAEGKAKGGVPGMGTGLEVKVLRGASW